MVDRMSPVRGGAAAWPDPPAADPLGRSVSHPAHVGTRLTDAAVRVTAKPAIFAATQLARAANTVDPGLLLRTSLSWVDVPRRLAPPVAGVTCRPVRLPDCAAEWLVPTDPDQRSDATVIYFHGSAFVLLGLNSHRPFVSRLARATGASVLNVAYGLRPRHDLEQAVQHGVDAYEHVLASGADPTRIVLAGDSAGGFVAAMVAIRLRELGLPRPAGQVLISPATDSDLAPKLAYGRQHPDAMFPLALARFLWRVYIGRNGAHDADPGPVDRDLAGLSPFLIHVGSHELLRPDAELLTTRLRAAGVRADLDVWEHAVHAFHVGPPFADTRAARASIYRFVQDVTDTGRPDRPRRRLRLIRGGR